MKRLPGEHVGLSNFVDYTIDERTFLSVAFANADQAEPGTEVIVTWGDPDGGSQKPQLELHRQTDVCAIIGPAPLAQASRRYNDARLSATV